MAIFRIAHVSDLHFSRYIDWFNPLESTAPEVSNARKAYYSLLNHKSTGAGVFYPSTFSPDVALSLLRKLIEEIPHLDAILITGDLATTGNNTDLQLARNFFAGVVPDTWHPSQEKLPSLLDDEDIQLITLPGNHDRYEGVLLQPLSNHFEKHFGMFWDFEREHAFGLAPSNRDTGRVRISTLILEDTALVVLTADLTLETTHQGEGNVGWLGQGRVHRPVIEELIKATNDIQLELKQDGLTVAVTWAVHFPPNFPEVNNALQLLESEILVNAAASCGVSLVFAGHTHQTLTYKTSSTDGSEVTVICSGPSAGISAHEQYAFSIVELDISIDGLVPTVTHFKWDNYKFVEQ
jgi:3',5'-cyclic AMP phosphodiesterase CpdA